jgi:hypothetical protein
MFTHFLGYYRNIKAKRSDTSESWICAIFFIMNLITLVKVCEKYAPIVIHKLKLHLCRLHIALFKSTSSINIVVQRKLITSKA